MGDVGADAAVYVVQLSHVEELARLTGRDDLGGIGGALLAANNYKMRTLIKKGQEEMQTKLDKLMDEKIEQMEEGVENLKEKAEETVENVKSKMNGTEKAQA